MNTLTTRQIVLGLLMTLVLAFSVPGIVDAQSVSVSGDGSTTSTSSGTTVITDYRTTPAVERSFTITVSKAENGEVITIRGSSDVTINEIKKEDKLTNETGSVTGEGSGVVTITVNAPNVGADRDLNGDNDKNDIVTSFLESNLDEDLNNDGDKVDTFGSISESDLNADLNGDGDQTDTLSSVKEYLEDPNWESGSVTITVDYTVTEFGRYTVTVTANEIDTDISGSPITAYVVRSDTLARGTSIATGSTTTPVLRTSSVSFTIAPATQWTRVDLKVTGGKLYLDSGRYLSSNKLFDVTQRKEFTSLSMFTGAGGSLTVNLIQDSGKVAKITATIPGSNARGKTYTVTSFASAITVEQVSGNHQFGYTNQGANYGSWEKLQNALVVRVVDGHQTNNNVEGQWVTFTTTGTSRLRATSRANLWPGADGTITAADDNQSPLTVKTDGSGRAQVYLLPGTTPATYTVTYAVVSQESPTALGTALTGAAASSQSRGAINEQFTATAILDPGDTREHVINRSESTPTPEIRRAQGDTEMIVDVENSGGTDAQNVQVDFSVSGGRLTLTPGSNYQTSLSTVTDSGGDARVWVQATGNSVAIVTARIAGNNEDAGRYVVTFLRTGAYIEYVSGDDQDGAIGGRLENPLVVKVLDGRGGSAMPNQIVRFNVTADDTNDHNSNRRQFIPVPDTYVFVTAANTDIFDEIGADMPDATSVPRLANALRPIRGSNGTGQNIFIQTDSNGEAKVYLRLGSADDTGTSDTVETVDAARFNAFKVHRVTATTPDGAPNVGVRFRADAVDDARQAKLEIVSGDRQSAEKGDPLADPLVVRVRTVRGFLIQGILLEFTALDGTLLTDPDHDTVLVSESGGGNQIRVRTGPDGEARVDYNVGQLRIARDVTVEVVEEQGTLQYDFAIDEVRFGVNGGQGTGTGGGTRQPPPPRTPTNTITITLSSRTGEPGDEIDVEVDSSPRGVLVTIDSGELDDDDFSRLSRGTPFTSTLLLPDEEGEYTFSAERSGFDSDTATVTVESETQGRILITRSGSPTANNIQTFSITVRGTDDAFISGPLTVRVTGPGINSNVRTANGAGAVDIPLPTASGFHTFTARAEGYLSGTIQVRGTGTAQQEATDDEEVEEEETPTVSVPDSISIVGPSQRSGTVNAELEAALIVQVLDDDGDAVEDAIVYFRVVSGRGRLSQRGNGRAIGVVTDDDGYARAALTPTGDGTITVRAEARGVTRTVEFTINTGSAPPTTRTPGTGVTPSTTVSPVVHVGAAKRPPMLWVDGGAIYALVGASPERFAPSVDNALNIAVSGGKVYWTEKTGESGGTINSANLNGTGVTELASIFATPIGIAVDAAGSKLYWTNSAGRIQSANLNGSGIQNVLQNLDNPMDLALAGGNVYWTQGNGSVRFVNLRGQKVVRNISTGLDTPGSLVIGGGKVYWTEKTGESGGTINSANLNNTGATQLASILAVPMGIAVDTARSKLYWTNSRGRVQSANLDGSKIQNVVSGLGSPGDMVLSNSIAAPAATTTTTTTRTTTTASKYDVNGDGSVDNADASLVAAAMNTSNTRYDVNGDGTVNFLDLLLVFDNRDPGAAGAPTIVGMKLSAAQIDRIEEQIDLLIATGDRSPAAMRTLIYLQQLLVMARPEKTQLLANYPNPFNPETWIPYELATDTHVEITIYNPQGVVIRRLQLGQQSAGYYTDRERAAYWDGRNALGEQVASGLYFYQFETDEMSSMRKMVILK